MKVKNKKRLSLQDLFPLSTFYFVFYEIRIVVWSRYVNSLCLHFEILFFFMQNMDKVNIQILV